MTIATSAAAPAPATATAAAPIVPSPPKSQAIPDQAAWVNRSRNTATAILSAIDAASTLRTLYVANAYADPTDGLKQSAFGASNAGKTPQHASDYANAIAALETALDQPIDGAPGAPTIRTALARFAKSK